MKRNLLLVVSFLSLCFLTSLFATHQFAQFQSKQTRFIPIRSFKKACGDVRFGAARCNAQVVTDKAGNPLAVPTAPVGAYGPDQFHTAYQLPCTPGGSVNAHCVTPSSFSGTIAIVDAYADPTVAADLSTYSQAYNLPPCTQANGCLQIVDQNGGNNLPSADSGWALEISLDTQIAHAVCQTCKILLVETNSASIADLGQGVNTAANLGAKAISNSYGGNEFSGELTYDSYYNHPGVAVTASAGDSGYGTEYPAASPDVVAVGGTTLSLLNDNTYSSESVWNGTGSGCSRYENANSWQASLSNWNLTGCVGKRAITDIAADADPNTGAGVYDSTPYSGGSGWWIVGGTSLSSPLIASSYVLAGGVQSGTNAGQVLYNNFPFGDFHDITSGSNGSCTTIMCKAGVGYDGPTGLGSPNGLAGFIAGQSVTPTPTPTGTITPTPTVTPTPIPSFTVTITSPTDGSLVQHRTHQLISATVSDAVAVQKVQFLINGTVAATRFNAPYVYNWYVPGGSGRVYTITAKAYDSLGSTSQSSVTVTSY